MIINFPTKKRGVILALGAESAGNFSVFYNGKIYISSNLGNLQEEKNWQKFKRAILQYLNTNKIKPNIILSDLHPLFKTTIFGKELAKKFNTKFIQIQHHHAHIFSAIGDKMINSKNYKLPAKNYAVAMDGTGLGEDDDIWGGEVFKIKNKKIKRIGHLENQTLIGGEMAIQEPARVLIAILSKFLKKNEAYKFIKKYYSKNEFELLWNQLKQNFNCIETSSTGRILDATSVLLDFSKNERKSKHGPTYLLEKNSSPEFYKLKPKIIKKTNGKYILNTSYVINYVISALSGSAFSRNCPQHQKNKQSLASTVQHYIANGLWEVIQKENKRKTSEIFAAGGLAKNKIISPFFKNKNIYTNKKIPCGDAGLSFGQIVFYLLKN